MSLTASCSTIFLATGIEQPSIEPPAPSSTAPSSTASRSDLPGAAAQSKQHPPGQVQTGPLRNLMNAMAPTLPTELQWFRVPLTTGPAAAAEARRQVRMAL